MMARTRFKAVFMGLGLDDQGETVLKVCAADGQMGRAAILLQYLAPRRMFTLRLLRNDTGGAVITVVVATWKVDDSGVWVFFKTTDKFEVMPLMEMAGREVVVDARETNDE